MILIGENIHIISKTVKEALLSRDLDFVKNMISEQKDMDCLDLNVGPCRRESLYEWLVPFVKEHSDLPLSFDTTNYDEMQRGLKLYGDCMNCFINSATADRFDEIADLALEYDSNLIILTLKGGIPKTADGRLEIAFELYEKALEKGLRPDKLYFDPLVLPVSADQSQAIEVINTIRMIKEGFDPPVKTVVGLSNVSNGSPKELRPLINRVFACFAHGAGLDAAIVDGRDAELQRIINVLDKETPEKDVDNFYLKISQAVRDFEDICNIEYNINSEEEQKIFKTVQIIANEKIYSHNFTQI